LGEQGCIVGAITLCTGGVGAVGTTRCGDGDAAEGAQYMDRCDTGFERATGGDAALAHGRNRWQRCV
jgi:hypothetical protein